MAEPGAGLRALFDQASVLPVERQDAFLREHCADPTLRAHVKRLLAAAALPDADWQSRDPEQWLRAMDEPEWPAALPAGTQLGPFRIEALLGEGGSARVYRARRTLAGVDQQVALKVLRFGMAAEDARRQFDRERQVLARLVHPHIARLVDAGITARGEAWIALEYIEGEHLLRYAQARGLEQRERIQLVLRIARAVAAAHRLLVVHRDLKPANVLVTPDGEVKLLDFGIAKMIQPDTGEGEPTQTRFRAFTPAYAAPEQQDGRAVTTATDVYSLGVLLCEVLTGRRPAVARGAGTTLRGDLATILSKATAAEPELRYDTAAAFADDLQRLLDGLPVHAHPPSRLYLLRKFVARHRGGVAVASVLTLGVLMALAAALWQAGVARQEAARARAVTSFLVGLFRSAEEFLPRHQRPTPELLVAHAREALETDRSLDRTTRAEVAATLAEVSRLAARYPEAASLLADARQQLAHLPEADPRLRRLRLAEARVHNHAGSHQQALDGLAALAIDARDPLSLRLDALALEAEAAYALGEHDRALAAAAARHGLAAQALGAAHPDTLRALLAHGVALAAAEHAPEALDLLPPALQRWQQAGLPLDRDFMAAARAEAAALQALSRLDDALAHSSRLLQLQRGIYTEPHDAIALTLRDQASILDSAGRSEEAIPIHRDSIAMLEAVLGTDHAQVAAGYTALGLSLAGLERLEEAEAAYRQAIAACSRGDGRSAACARAQANLGMTLYRQQRFGEAEVEITRALARYREIHGERHLNIAVSLTMLSNVATADGRAAEAVGLTRQALAIMDDIGMADTRDALLMRNSLATTLWMLDHNAEALVEIDRSIEGFDRVQPGQAVRRTMMRVLRAQILLDLGRAEDALQAAEDALAMGATPAELPAFTRKLLRELTGRPGLFGELDALP